MTQSHSGEGPNRRAVRATFDYEGDEITLRHSETLEKRVPPSDPLLRDGDAGSRSGFWVELSDEEQRTVWRRVMHDPRVASLEAPAGDRPGELTRTTVGTPRGSFRMVLPDRDDVHYVTVVASPLVPTGSARGARVMGRFDLLSGERVGPGTTPAKKPKKPKKPKKRAEPRRGRSDNGPKEER